MKLNPILCAFALGLAATSAHAIVYGFDPETTPATIPGYATQTPNWKFVGKVGGSASAVQAAPRWILASRHATPPVGSTFTNAFGSATVASCVFPTATYTPTSDTDLSLCRLATPIALPAGTALPAVVGFSHENPFALASIDHWGDLLGTGYSTGARRSAWSTFGGLAPGFYPYDYALNPAGRYVNIDAIQLARTAGGDSGGGVYFYPSAPAPSPAPAGYLIGVLTGEGPIGLSPSYLRTEFAQWIVQTIAGAGDQAPQLADIGQLVPNNATRLPRNMASGSVTAAVTGPTSASVSFTAPPNPNNTTPITRYLILAQGANTPPIVQQRYAPGTYGLTGLVDGRLYQACVVTGNSLGFGANVTILFGTRMLERPGCASFTAGAPNAPLPNWGYKVTKNAATGKVDLAADWQPPPPNGVTTASYVATVKVWAGSSDYGNKPPIRTTTVQTSATSFKLASVISGNEWACWSVSARSTTQVVGPAIEGLCFIVSSAQ